MLRVVRHPDVYQELESAALRYEQQQPPGQQGLGLGAKAANNPHTDPMPVKPEDIVSPSLMIAIGDSIHANAFSLLSDGDASIGILYWVSERIAGSHSRSLRRHQANANYLFCDGHVATLPIQSLLIGVTDEYGKMWNRDGESHLDRL